MADAREVVSRAESEPIDISDEEVRALGGEAGLPDMFDAYTLSDRLRCDAGELCGLTIDAQKTAGGYALKAVCGHCPQAGAHQHVLRAILRDASQQVRRMERRSAEEVEALLAPRPTAHEIIDRGTGQLLHVVDADALLGIMPSIGGTTISRLLNRLLMQSFRKTNPYPNAVIQSPDLWRQLHSKSTAFIVVEHAAAMLTDERYLQAVPGMGRSGINLLGALYEKLVTEGYIQAED